MVAFNDLYILIADPKAANVKLLRGLLAMLGVKHISHAATSDQALDLVRTEDFQLIFCDEGLGPMDAATFAVTLRKDKAIRNRRTPIIVLSNRPPQRQVELARDSGVNDLLLWPLSLNAVKRKLLSILLSPKAFIDSESFHGPDRRIRSEAPASDGNQASKKPRSGKWARRKTDRTVSYLD